MKKTGRICAIILDKTGKDKHDYTQVRYDDGRETSEKGFDLEVTDKESDIPLLINKLRSPDCIITIGDDIDFSIWENLPKDMKLRCVHMESFDAIAVGKMIVSVFKENINGKTHSKFSIFTSLYNTPKECIDRLYKSLLSQTYNNWDWFIIDDGSDNGTASDYISSKNDYRITILKNVTDYGRIGFNKHMAAMCCDGDYLVEIDHDDEITPDCLEKMKEAFDKYPDAGFCYSDCLELINGEAVWYGDDFSFGQGTYRKEVVNGKEYNVAITTPSINPKSIRGIYAEPNHVRCWRKDVYHKIGGHNTSLSVLDDMDIMIRTFLETKMIHISKVLYIQHEDGRNEEGNGRAGTAQGHRFAEIQRTNWLLYDKYDKAIHKRISELGCEDTIWDETMEQSALWMQNVDLPSLSYEIS